MEEIAPMFLLAFQTIFSLGLTSDVINKGMITLISKSEDHSKLGNWRPITLLDSIYNFFAEILARKIQVHLHFMMGRSIMDNNFLAQESLEWAVENGHDLIMLLLDFEKNF